MADKRISQLIERTDIANNDVLPIVASGATTTNKVTVSTLQDWMQDNLDVGVTSVGLSVPSAFTVSGSPVTTSGNITISGAGTTAQYIRGDGSLADFPSSLGGGGASVSYYLNGSVSQGTIGGVAYRELSKSPILGSGTDFTINADGYIASFITDAGDPSLLEIPGGNWNFETYFQASSGGGTPSFYVELYKVSSGGTATLIATSSGSPELIAFGTNTTPYFSSLAVPTTTLALTDRLAIRYYVAHSGRTITLHTENNTLCQIITTFTTGLTALNGLTAQVQNFATGTSGTDFNISSASTTHTFNLPDASASARGVVTTGTQTFAGYKIFNGTIGANVDIQLATQGTALNTFIKNINATGQTSIGSNGFGFNNANNIYFSGSSKGGGIIAFNNTGNQTYTLQNASGTLAFTSDLNSYLPLTGGTLTGTLAGTAAVFSGSIDANNGTNSTNGIKVISSLSSSLFTGGIEFLRTTVTAGSKIEPIRDAALGGVGLRFLTTLNNSAESSGTLTTAMTIAPTGGVTLTGALNGTSASFGGTGTGNNVISISNNDQSNARLRITNTGSGGRIYSIVGGLNGANNSSFSIYDETAGSTRFEINSTGAATFSSSVTAAQGVFNGSGSNDLLYLDAGINTDFAFKIVSGSNDVLTLRRQHSTLGNLDIISYGFNGNVGIGTSSPQTAGGGYTGLHINGNGASLVLSTNGSNLAYLYTSGTGGADFRIENPGAQIFAAGSSERMRITSAGNVGIGTASPSVSLNVVGNAKFETSSGNRYIEIASSTSSIQIGTDGSSQFLYGVGNFPLTFSTNASERMRITSGGFVLVNRTSTLNNGWFEVNGDGSRSGVACNQVSTASSAQIYFSNPNGIVGSIFSSGSATSYNTSSDYRLKENIKPVENALSILNQLKPCSFNFIADADEEVMGFIAHEVQEVIPQAVTGEKDGFRIEEVEVSPAELDEEGNVITEAVIEEKEIPVYQGIDHSKLVPLLVAAIQELKTEIDSLKNQTK